MRSLNNYKKFNSEKREPIINESFIYYSKKLKKLFDKIDHPISERLKELEYKFVDRPDMTFIDISKDGFLSYIPMKKAKNLISMDGNPEEDLLTQDILRDLEEGDFYNNKMRTDIKIGRFINNFIKDFSSKEVEEFVNILKSKINIEKNKKIRLVSGEEIKYWYKRERLLEKKGTINSSCMLDKPNYLEIYVKNPEVCQLVILTTEFEGEEFLIARAILWKVSNNDFKHFMDRTYSINDSDLITLKDWSKSQGFAYRTKNSYSDYSEVTFNGKNLHMNLEVKLKSMDYQYYPYMDTFKRYDPQNYTLYNDEERYENEGNLILTNTDGTGTEVEDTVYSEYHDEYIPREDSIWSDVVESYILIEYSIVVNRGSHSGVYPRDYDNIVECTDGELAHTDDCVYSDFLEGYVYIDQVNYLVSDLYNVLGDCGELDVIDDEKNNKMLDINVLKELFWYNFVNGWDGADFVYKDLLQKNWKGDLIPKACSLDVFGVLDRNFEVDYLSKIDAVVLGVHLDLNDIRKTDYYEYTKSLEPIINQLETNLNEYPKKLKSQLNIPQIDRTKWIEREITNRMYDFDILYKRVF